MISPQHRCKLRHFSRAGFSLIEIALSLGIFAFVGVALIGLFSVGLKTNRQSVDELEATTLAQSLLNTRRAMPTNAIPNFALPVLDKAAEVSTGTPVLLASDGTIATSSTAARFGLIYRIVLAPASASVSSVYVCLYWPALTTPDKAEGRCEMIGKIKLPEASGTAQTP